MTDLFNVRITEQISHGEYSIPNPATDESHHKTGYDMRWRRPGRRSINTEGIRTNESHESHMNFGEREDFGPAILREKIHLDSPYSLFRTIC